MAAAVRARYGSADAVAAGAWTWMSPNGTVWVLIDVQSTVPDLVQARAELWAHDGQGELRVGQSDVMPAAAEFGAFEFDDATGDGVPDLLGYVADSAAVAYAVFIPGARGAMADQLEDAARGWRFATDPPNLPQLLRGSAGPCALQLWADSALDGLPAGWRYLAIARGSLGAPAAVAPACP